jgi:hypothetical protein
MASTCTVATRPRETLAAMLPAAIHLRHQPAVKNVALWIRNGRHGDRSMTAPHSALRLLFHAVPLGGHFPRGRNLLPFSKECISRLASLQVSDSDAISRPHTS